MVNIDINQKSIEKESRPKHDTGKQLPPHEPEGASSKSGPKLLMMMNYFLRMIKNYPKNIQRKKKP